MVFKSTSLQKFIFLVTVRFSIAQLANNNGPLPLGEYQKLKTQFDGVTFEESITYLSLSNEDYASLPLTTCNDVGNPIDFTFKFWFKMFNVDESSEYQFLNFPGSVVCYTQGALTIICNTPERQELLVKIDQFTNGMWYYFTLSVRSDGHAELNIFNRFGQLSTDSEEQFYFIQNSALNWSVCLGLCDNSKEFSTGFTGGIREVIGQNNFTTVLSLQQTANQIQKYSKEIKGYYRFAGQNSQMFLLEQFRETQTNVNGLNFSEAIIGKDLIPIDMCPQSFNTKSLLTLTNNQNSIQSVPKTELGKNLAISKYAYTMSLTVFIQSNTAITNDYLDAQNDQNIVFVDGVFMLYMYAQNIARFHFYAKQNFYESQSSGFFVPYNQWITIQMQMTEFGGYQVVVLDEQSQVIISFQRKQNMNAQLPSSKYSLFSGLAGFVGKFAFVDQAYNLPKAYSQLLNPLILVDFSKAPNITTNSFSNNGSSGDLQFSQPIVLTNFPYKVTDYGYQVPSLPVFDGISCNDRHGTIMLNSPNLSNFTFTTPIMPDWMSETSISFWFKINNFSFVNDPSIPTKTILTMQGGNKTDNYWTVFIKGGQLIVSPFGIYQLSNPSIIFSEFNSKNMDQIGWWHLSCYYQFLMETGCTLYNKQIEITKTISLSSLSQFFFPKYSLQAVFGKSSRQGNPGIQQLLLKDVRYWSRKVPLLETQRTRFQQIDPVYSNNLLSYFRLTNGLLTQQNFAEQNPAYTFTGSKPQLQNASVYSDFIIQSQLQFDNDNQQLITVQNKIYQNVCPLYTYMKDGFCYSEPVNELQLLIFPQWNTTENKLDWFFTLEHSNLIKISLFNILDAVWTSDDPSLQSLFNGKPYNFLIPSDLLIKDNTYKITAALTNDQKYSYQSQTIEFTPNNCHWFEVGISDAFSGYEQIPYNPGDKDFYFKLVLVKNPTFECQNFKFYDSFNYIDFKFIIAGDDGTFIDDQPIPNFSITGASNSADNGNSSNDSSKTANDLTIYVTLPALEQLKIPAWTDVKIIMKLSWTSSIFNNYITHQSVFQNAMFTLQFNPQDNYLIPQIQQSSDYVLFGQTFILTTQNTTISSLYPSLISNMLTYQWICPQELALLCIGQSNDTFYVPWNSLSTVPLEFGNKYTFGVQITWNKPDGNQDVKNLTVQVIWYNYSEPQFTINASLPILITNTQPTNFTIVGKNFNAAQLSAFNVTWSIVPNPINQSDFQIVNQGQVLIVSPGNWAQQTSYIVTAEMVFIQQPSINGSSSLTFSTSTFPQNGSVTISPQYGYIGDTFTIVVANFTDLNQPVTYNVYSSNDSLGLIPNIQFTNTSLPQSTKINKYKFKFQAIDSNPIIVVVQDIIGEQVTIILTPWIVPLPPQICTNVTTCPNSTDNSSTTSNNSNITGQAQNSTTNSSGQRLLSTKVIGSISKLTNQTVTNQTNNSASNSTNNSASNLTNNSQQVPQCKIITTCIQPQFNFTLPVSNNISNNSSLGVNSSNSSNITSDNYSNSSNQNSTNQNQTFISVNSSSKKSQLQQTVSNPFPNVNNQKSGNSKANLSSSQNQSLLKNSSRGLQDSQLLDTLEQILKYNTDFIQACKQINTEISLQISQNNQEIYLKVFDQLVTRYDSAICILESLRTFFQNQTLNDNQDKLMEHLISYTPLDTNYKGKQIQVISIPFNSKTSQSVEMNIFTSSYLFDAQDIYSQLPEQPTYDFFMQCMGMKNLDGSTDVYLRVIDSVSLQVFDMSQLSGQVQIKFKIIQSKFVSGQSLCQAKLRQGWTSDVCQTQIEIEMKDALCRCSMTQGATMISFKNDQSQEIGQPILFPSEPFIPEFKGISLFFVATISIITLIGVISPLIVWRLDRKDQAEIKSLSAWKLDLIKTVAIKLNQPIQYVKLRQRDIITAYVFNRNSSVFEIMYKIHPLFAPFNTFIAEQTRLLRFNAYYIQINIFVIGCMIYFGPQYRQDDLLRQQLFLDSVDVGSISSAATIGSIILLPILSSPIQYCLQDKVNPSSGVVIQRFNLLKNFFMTIVNLGMNTCVVLIAVQLTRSIPTSNQYLISSSIFCGIFLSVFVSNVIRVMVNCFLPNSFLSAYVTKQLVKDLNAIRDLNLSKICSDSVQTTNEIEVKGLNPFDYLDESSRRKLSTSTDNVGNDQSSLSFDKQLNKASKSIL